MLEELGMDYNYHLVDLTKGESKSDEYLAINPAGKLPSIMAEGQVLTESCAIVNYLAAGHPDAEFIPIASPFRRALYDQWCLFSLTELEQPLWTMSKHRFALPKDQRCTEVLSTAIWEFQKALILLSKGLGEKDYILGEQFTGADILLAHTLFWGMAFKQQIEQENLKAYLGRAGVRPALAAARSREQAVLRNKQH